MFARGDTGGWGLGQGVAETTRGEDTMYCVRLPNEYSKCGIQPNTSHQVTVVLPTTVTFFVGTLDIVAITIFVAKN